MKYSKTFKSSKRLISIVLALLMLSGTLYVPHMRESEAATVPLITNEEYDYEVTFVDERIPKEDIKTITPDDFGGMRGIAAAVATPTDLYSPSLKPEGTIFDRAGANGSAINSIDIYWDNREVYLDKTKTKTGYRALYCLEPEALLLPIYVTNNNFVQNFNSTIYIDSPNESEHQSISKVTELGPEQAELLSYAFTFGQQYYTKFNAFDNPKSVLLHDTSPSTIYAYDNPNTSQDETMDANHELVRGAATQLIIWAIAQQWYKTENNILGQLQSFVDNYPSIRTALEIIWTEIWNKYNENHNETNYPILNGTVQNPNEIDSDSTYIMKWDIDSETYTIEIDLGINIEKYDLDKIKLYNKENGKDITYSIKPINGIIQKGENFTISKAGTKIIITYKPGENNIIGNNGVIVELKQEIITSSLRAVVGYVVSNSKPSNPNHQIMATIMGMAESKNFSYNKAYFKLEIEPTKTVEFTKTIYGDPQYKQGSENITTPKPIFAFDIYKIINGNEIYFYTFKTDTSGNKKLTLPYGEYLIKEQHDENSKSYYLINKKIKIPDDKQTTQAVELRNIFIRDLEINKIMEDKPDDKTASEGIKFRIYPIDKKGYTDWNEIENGSSEETYYAKELSVNANGQLIFSKVPQGEYWIEELPGDKNIGYELINKAIKITTETDSLKAIVDNKYLAEKDGNIYLPLENKLIPEDTQTVSINKILKKSDGVNITHADQIEYGEYTITLTPTGTPDNRKVYSFTLNKENNWTVTNAPIAAGDYIVEETFGGDNCQIEFSENVVNRIVSINADDDVSITVTNIIDKTDIVVEKTMEEREDSSGLTFRIYPVDLHDKYENGEISWKEIMDGTINPENPYYAKEFITSDDGSYTLENIPYGTYWIEELPSAKNNGYYLINETITITNQGYKIDGGELKGYENKIETGTYTYLPLENKLIPTEPEDIKDYPLITVTKLLQDSDGNPKNPGNAEYRVKLTSTDGSKVYIFTLNKSNNWTVTTNVKIGDYNIKEINGGANCDVTYSLNSEKTAISGINEDENVIIPITESDDENKNTLTITVTNKEKTKESGGSQYVKIIKILQNSNGEVIDLTGEYEVTLFNKNDTDIFYTFTLNKSNGWEFTQNIEIGEYTVEETLGGENCTVTYSVEEQNVNVTKDRSIEIFVTNTHKKTNIITKKTMERGSDSPNGLKFRLYPAKFKDDYKSGKITWDNIINGQNADKNNLYFAQEFTVDDKGECTLKDVPNGKYWIDELPSDKNADYYLINEEVIISGEIGEYVIVPLTNILREVTYVKTMERRNDNPAGIKFRIYPIDLHNKYKNGQISWENIIAGQNANPDVKYFAQEFVIDANGKSTLTGVPRGTYWIEELSSVQNNGYYLINEKITITDRGFKINDGAETKFDYQPDNGAARYDTYVIVPLMNLLDRENTGTSTTTNNSNTTTSSNNNQSSTNSSNSTESSSTPPKVYTTATEDKENNNNTTTSPLITTPTKPDNSKETTNPPVTNPATQSPTEPTIDDDIHDRIPGEPILSTPDNKPTVGSDTVIEDNTVPLADIKFDENGNIVLNENNNNNNSNETGDYNNPPNQNGNNNDNGNGNYNSPPKINPATNDNNLMLLFGIIAMIGCGIVITSMLRKKNKLN